MFHRFSLSNAARYQPLCSWKILHASAVLDGGPLAMQAVRRNGIHATSTKPTTREGTNLASERKFGLY